MLNHPQRPIKESHEMTGGLSTLIHQLLSIPLSDCDEELVETHGGVDCDFAAEEGLDVVVLDRIGRFIGDERGQAWREEEQGDVGRGVSKGLMASRAASEPELKLRLRELVVAHL